MRPPADFGLMTPAARVIEEVLALRPGERLLVIHDRANDDIARAFEHAALEAKGDVERLELEALAARPCTSCPPEILVRLKPGAASSGGGESGGATILAIRTEEGEYDMRRTIVNAAMAMRARHVHMVGVSRRAFVASMMAPSTRVFELIQTLKSAMRPQTRIAVRSAAGTQIEIEMAPHLRWFANGSVVRPGQWLNVPYGAVVSSPASVTGVYVADAAVGGALGARTGSLAGRPIKLTLEGGRLKAVECRDTGLKTYVERFAADAQNQDRVGLISLGTNIGVLSPLGEIIHDENMPGLHLALGDSFGGSTSATWSAHGQLAFAMSEADVDLDGQPLIRRGRYVRYV